MEPFLPERAATATYQPQALFKHESCCSGGLMECFGFRAMDMAYTTLYAVDTISADASS